MKRGGYEGGETMKSFKNIGLLGVIAFSALVLTACTQSKTTGGSSNQSVSSTSTQSEEGANAVVITYSEGGFSPASVKVKVGQEVTFKNTSSSNVEVNSAPHPTHTLYPELNINGVAAGASGSTTFSKAGTYKYHNHLNAGQNGTIVVE